MTKVIKLELSDLVVLQGPLPSLLLRTQSVGLTPNPEQMKYLNNTNNTYFYKYLKYKEKYINLRKKYTGIYHKSNKIVQQKGGFNTCSMRKNDFLLPTIKSWFLELEKKPLYLTEKSSHREYRRHIHPGSLT